MDERLEEIQEELTAAKLVSGDKVSIYAVGMAVSQILKLSKVAVLMVDALGRIQIVPQSAVKVLKPARVENADLDILSEDEAISVMVSQEDSEKDIMSYLAQRNHRKAF